MVFLFSSAHLMKRFFISLVLIAFAYVSWTEIDCRLFCYKNIIYPNLQERVDIPFVVNSSTADIPKEVHTQFPQTWTYLGRGNQIFAFESADHQYVLKFFRFVHLKPSLVARVLSTERHGEIPF